MVVESITSGSTITSGATTPDGSNTDEPNTGGPASHSRTAADDHIGPFWFQAPTHPAPTSDATKDAITKATAASDVGPRWTPQPTWGEPPPFGLPRGAVPLSPYAWLLAHLRHDVIEEMSPAVSSFVAGLPPDYTHYNRRAAALRFVARHGGRWGRRAGVACLCLHTVMLGAIVWLVIANTEGWVPALRALTAPLVVTWSLWWSLWDAWRRIYHPFRQFPVGWYHVVHVGLGVLVVVIASTVLVKCVVAACLIVPQVMQWCVVSLAKRNYRRTSPRPAWEG